MHIVRKGSTFFLPIDVDAGGSYEDVAIMNIHGELVLPDFCRIHDITKDVIAYFKLPKSGEKAFFRARIEIPEGTEKETALLDCFRVITKDGKIISFNTELLFHPSKLEAADDIEVIQRYLALADRYFSGKVNLKESERGSYRTLCLKKAVEIEQKAIMKEELSALKKQKIPNLEISAKTVRDDKRNSTEITVLFGKEAPYSIKAVTHRILIAVGEFSGVFPLEHRIFPVEPCYVKITVPVEVTELEILQHFPI